MTTTTTTHGMQLETDDTWTVLRFPASRFCVLVDGRGVPHAPATALDLGPVDAVCNGPMFSIPSGGGSYSTYQLGTLDFRHLDRSRGVDVPSRYPARGACIYLGPDGQAHAITGGVPPATATVALQGSPALVRDGREVHSDAKDPGRVWRPALVRVSAAELAFVLGKAVSMETLARKCHQLGTDALYLDGGGSAHVVVRGGGTFGAREQRRVPSWAAVSRESVLPALPGVVGAVPAATLAGGAAVAVGLALGLGAIVAATRSA